MYLRHSGQCPPIDGDPQVSSPGPSNSSENLMPIKVRRSKARTSRVIDEARAIFKDALKLQDIRWDCIRSVARHQALGS
jgi:hypothetical protein